MSGFSNPALAEIRTLLQSIHSIAVVGLSDNPARPSHRVAAYLQAAGYQILPINPMIREALGQPAWPDLAALPGPVDCVCIFRRGEEAPAIIEAAIGKVTRLVWMQDQVVSLPAALRAREAGLAVVMNDCMLRRHQSLIGLT
ncbi:MAG: CoA-binding protein [bacterium]|jgi:hypothetical protein|nr:CoA-binding protein [bacterium]